ncbi:MAG: hypothetical protein NVS1B14_04800 [Vulcanimicrobiaceae bacterium]
MNAQAPAGHREFEQRAYSEAVLLPGNIPVHAADDEPLNAERRPEGCLLRTGRKRGGKMNKRKSQEDPFHLLFAGI